MRLKSWPQARPKTIIGLLDTSKKRNKLRNRIVRFLETHGNFASFSLKDIREELKGRFPHREIRVSDLKDRIIDLVTSVNNRKFVVEDLTHPEEAAYFQQETGMQIVNTSELIDPEGHTTLRSRLEQRFHEFMERHRPGKERF